jgi:hypothetical protein
VLFLRRAAQTILMTGALAYCVIFFLGLAAAAYGYMKDPSVGADGYWSYSFAFSYRQALAGLIVLLIPGALCAKRLFQWK